MNKAASASSPSSKLIEGFRRDCQIRGLSKGSIPRYLSVIKIFSQYLERRGVDLLEVDRDILRDFLEYLRIERNVAHKTVENYFTVLSTLYEYLAYEGYIDLNPVLPVRKRYVRRYKDNNEGQMRKLISIEEMKVLINSVVDVRDKAIITLLAKTGILRNELITLDVEDIDWIDHSIKLKPTPKRSNRVVFFDDETAFILRRWLRARNSRDKVNSKALFIKSYGGRLNRNGIYLAVTKAAERVGLHEPNSDKMEGNYSAHRGYKMNFHQGYHHNRAPSVGS